MKPNDLLASKIARCILTENEGTISGDTGSLPDSAATLNAADIEHALGLPDSAATLNAADIEHAASEYTLGLPEFAATLNAADIEHAASEYTLGLPEFAATFDLESGDGVNAAAGIGNASQDLENFVAENLDLFEAELNAIENHN